MGKTLLHRGRRVLGRYGDIPVSGKGRVEHTFEPSRVLRGVIEKEPRAYPADKPSHLSLGEGNRHSGIAAPALF